MLKSIHNRLRQNLALVAGCTLAVLATATQAQAQSPYCLPVSTNGTNSGDYIGRVMLGSINNVTLGSALPHYTYFDTLNTNLLEGSANTIILSPGTYVNNNNLAAWIDYNQNNVFENSEMLGSVHIDNPFPAADSIVFTVPGGAMPGVTRLRVREWYANSPTPIGPCSNASYGETEDYNVTIIPATPCAGTPTAGTLPTSVSACGQTSITLSPSGATLAGGIQYQWQQSPDGGVTFVSIPGATNVSYTFSTANFTTGAFFRLEVTCTNSGQTASVVTYVGPATPPPVVNPNITVCMGQTFQLSASGAAGMTYSWTGPNGFTSTAQNPTITNANWGLAGNYQVVGMLNGCASAPAFTQVSISQGQMFLWITSNQPVCPGNTLMLTAGGGVPGQYSWTGPNGFSTITNGANVVSIPNLQPVNYGTYTVTAGGGTSCNATATINVGAPQGPSAYSNSPVCPGADIVLGIDSVWAAQSFSWIGPNGFTSTLQNPVIANADTSNSGLYTVYAQLNGCVSEPTVIQVDVNGTLTVVTASSDTVNQGSTLVLNAIGSNGNYQWTGPNGYSAVGHSPYIANVTPAHAGDYTVTLSSAGCNTVTAITTVHVNPMNQISGQVYNDANNNGIQDAGEGPLAGVLIDVQPSNYMAYTDSSGMYSVYVPDNTYTVSVAGLWPNQTATPGSISVTVSGSNQVSGGHNFGIHSTTVNNLAVSVTEVWTAAPGFTTYHRINYQNLGTNPMSGTIKYLPDPALSPNSNTSSHTLSGDTLIWSFSNLMPGQTAFKYFYSTVPVTTALGTVLNSTAWITPLAGDIDSTNNSFTLPQLVTGSWDPNDKAVLPAGPITPAQITAGQDLVYTIRFQNTGTAPAVNVLVMDRLSANLDWSSFQMLSSSHSYDLTMHENGLLEWRFNNIMLPDSNTNEPASHGDIQFRIKPKSTLVVGDVIENTAHIYFDFNEAVITNTTHTPVALPNAAPEAHNLNFLHVYPNPNNGQAILRFTAANPAETTVTLLNLLGQEVQRVVRQTQAGEIEIPVELQQQPAGIYLVRVVQNGMVYSGKLIRQ